ncbi:MAG: hypothetical protein ACXWJK_09165 [Burkholderiaceae bacterium]
MAVVKKLTLGFLLEVKAFRVESLRGSIIDALLEARGSAIPKTYYTAIAEGRDGGLVSLMNEDEGNLLMLDRQNVIFTKNSYAKGHVDLDSTFKEFINVFGVVQRVANFKGVRRIGLVAEHRFDAIKNNNVELLANLTKLPTIEFPGHFTLHFESRAPATSSPLDTAKGAFTNVIRDFYDSALDTSVPAEGKINANVDFQRYYAPALDTKISEAAEQHFFGFKKELSSFNADIIKLGFKK